MIKKIAILTSGGDAPGMNQAVLSITKAAMNSKMEVYFIYEGYKGLLEKQIIKVELNDIKGIGPKGGTILFSSRFPEFANLDVQIKGAKILNNMGIQALIAIGGDGTFKGARALSNQGIKTIGLPGTIDNDINSTDYTIGFSTSLTNVVESIEKIKDTSESHGRCHVVEIMGRDCGNLTISAALASNANIVSTPEQPLTTKEIIEKVIKARKQGHRSIIVAVTEKLYDIKKLETEIEKQANVETRSTILSHLQRGGVPTPEDRLLATKMGNYAINLLLQNKHGLCVGITADKITHKQINAALEMPKKTK